MRVDTHRGMDELLLPILKVLVPKLSDVQIPIHFPTARLFDSFKSHARLSGIWSQLRKQYDTQVTRSLLEMPDIFGLCIVDKPAACTSSSPSAPVISATAFIPLHRTSHASRVSRQLSSVTAGSYN